MNNTQKPSGEKRRGSIRVPVALMLVVCMGVSVYLGVWGVQGYLENQKGSDFYGDLSSGMKMTAAPTQASTPQLTQEATALPAQTATQTPKEQPVVFTPQPGEGARELTAAPQGPVSEVDFDTLRKTCPDIVGWVTIPETVIDYPIVHGEDNDFYLDHLPDRTRNANGSIMLDIANSGDFADDVSILHGHHMKSGAMFGDLELYKKEAYYKEHPVMRLYTPQGDYDVAVFAACSVDGSKFVYPTNFADEKEFDAFCQYAVTRSPYRTDVEVAYGDRILMLSTCAYAYEYERYLVLGKILEHQEGERDVK